MDKNYLIIILVIIQPGIFPFKIMFSFKRNIMIRITSFNIHVVQRNLNMHKTNYYSTSVLKQSNTLIFVEGL